MLSAPHAGIKAEGQGNDHTDGYDKPSCSKGRPSDPVRTIDFVLQIAPLLARSVPIVVSVTRHRALGRLVGGYQDRLEEVGAAVSPWVWRGARDGSTSVPLPGLADGCR